MPIELELSEAFLRSRRSNKWHLHPSDVIPAFVADMDLKVADPIHAAIERIVSLRDYGYAKREGDNTVQAAYARFMRRRFGVAINADLVQPVGDLVQATFASILAFSEPGDGVILHVPNYPPFREAITATGEDGLSVRLSGDALLARNGVAIPVDGLTVDIGDATPAQ